MAKDSQRVQAAGGGGERRASKVEGFEIMVMVSKRL
jgi:hypothetical protein